MFVGMLAALLLGPVLGDFSDDPELRHLQSLPRDVRVHIDRWRTCGHWGGEEPYDADRRRQIEAAERDLKCSGLLRSEQRLRHRYAASPTILRALSEAHGLYQ